MDSLNWSAIIAMTVVNFVFGHLWFGVFFGKQWQRIHGVDGMDQKTKKEMMKGMWKIMVSELVSTFLIMTGLAWVIYEVPEYSGIQNALILWIVFVLPISISNVIWGADKREYMIGKIAINIGGRLIPMIIAGYVLTQF